MENFLLSVVLFILFYSIFIKVLKQPLPSIDTRSLLTKKIPPKTPLTTEKTAFSSNFPPPSLESPFLPQLTTLEETPATIASMPAVKLTETARNPSIITTYSAQLPDYLAHPDSAIRASVATELGNQMAETSVRAETMPIIASLGRLSQDSDPLVRQSAVIALGKIASEKVITFLKRALRDVDSDVVKCASAAIDKYKGYSVRSLKPPTKKTAKRLPKPTL